KKSNNCKRQCENAVSKQHERHILLHGDYYSATGETKLILISSIMTKILSIPCFFSADVRKNGGTSSNQVKRAFLNWAICCSDFVLDCLSAFVNISTNGRPFSPNHWQNSKSIF